MIKNKRRFDAKLDGFEGPTFPDAVMKFQDLIEFLRHDFNYLFLSLAVSAIPYPPYDVSITRSTTSDGYTWFWSIGIHRDNNVVVVLIPWELKEPDREDSPDNRSMAVYILGEWTEREITDLLEKLIVRIWTLVMH